MKGKTRIAIVDDHPMFRDSVRRLLSLEPDFEIIAEAAGGDEVIALLETHEPDVLLLDLMMPGLDGLSVLQRIRGERFKTKVIVLTASEDESSHILAMKYGADGIVRKNSATDFLIGAIRKVREGQVCLDDTTMVAVMQQFTRQTQAHQPLSRREKEIVAAVSEGLSNKEIGAKLFISANTVKTHLLHIFKKVGVHDRVGLFLHATNLF
ncbi:MAG: response regulator transcription factor [Deltaproteobacteria bacterium]|nr:response regulator transcription factor [Deltaproteobacteria bacterium]